MQNIEIATPALNTQINERSNEPKMLCDLCIIQLNVAYNFKRLANRTEADMHQYLIEMGLPVSTATASAAAPAAPAPAPTPVNSFPTENNNHINANVLNPMHSATALSVVRRIISNHPPPVPQPSTNNNTPLADIAIKVEPMDNNDVIAMALQTDAKPQNQSPVLASEVMVHIPASVMSNRSSRMSLSGDSAHSSTDIEFINSFLPSSASTMSDGIAAKRTPMYRHRHSTGFIVADAKRRTQMLSRRRQSGRELRNLEISLLEGKSRPLSRLRACGEATLKTRKE